MKEPRTLSDRRPDRADDADDADDADVRRGVVARLRAAGCVFAEDEAELLLAAVATAPELTALVARRVAGLPLEQVLGWAQFCGLRVAVEPGVFVPRARTALLVREAVALGRARLRAGREAAAGTAGGVVVLDLCCGTGAVGLAVATALAAAPATERATELATAPAVELHAGDVEAAAVRCARRNLAGVGGVVHGGDLYDALPDQLRGRVDVLVANAPYVPTGSLALMPPEARLHEPRVALDGGGDGLDVQRRVARGAPAWLAPGGHLLVETSERQAPGSLALLRASGLSARVVRAPELDATVVVASLPRTAPALGRPLP